MENSVKGKKLLTFSLVTNVDNSDCFITFSDLSVLSLTWGFAMVEDTYCLNFVLQKA